ncbi:toxin-antitoxin system YwqK family antitoxin [Streptomyces sp. bgisy154]|uniref:toxin-antitoxin system YwqK family antitoxin n=1 Tax=Streptomyces sp. bgisy154 TaxID=3413794 RepID=UPI003D71714A
MMDLLRINIDSPDATMDDGELLYYQGSLFTGEAVEYQRGALVSLITYKDGIEDGPVREWYTDGTLRSEGAMRNGFPVGEFRRWHPNGRLAARTVMSANGLHQLARFEWDEDGNLTKEWHAEKGRGSDSQ